MTLDFFFFFGGTPRRPLWHPWVSPGLPWRCLFKPKPNQITRSVAVMTVNPPQKKPSPGAGSAPATCAIRWARSVRFNVRTSWYNLLTIMSTNLGGFFKERRGTERRREWSRLTQRGEALCKRHSEDTCGKKPVQLNPAEREARAWSGIDAVHALLH